LDSRYNSRHKILENRCECSIDCICRRLTEAIQSILTSAWPIRICSRHSFCGTGSSFQRVREPFSDPPQQSQCRCHVPRQQEEEMVGSIATKHERPQLPTDRPSPPRNHERAHPPFLLPHVVVHCSLCRAQWPRIYSRGPSLPVLALGTGSLRKSCFGSA
jgi:hypothetical protein